MREKWRATKTIQHSVIYDHLMKSIISTGSHFKCCDHRQGRSQQQTITFEFDKTVAPGRIQSFLEKVDCNNWADQSAECICYRRYQVICNWLLVGGRAAVFDLITLILAVRRSTDCEIY